MSCNGCRKSEKPTVTDVACTKERSHLGKVSLLSSLTGGISGYALESSSLFWGYLRWMPKEEYWIVYFLLFSGKIILKRKTKNEETLFSTCPVYWSLVLYQHCSKIKEQKSEEILLKTCLKRLIVYCMAGDLAAADVVTIKRALGYLRQVCVCGV